MKNSTKGIISLIILTLIFASIGLFSRYLNLSFHLFQQTYIRMFFAFLLGLILFKNSLHIKKLAKISSKEWTLLFFRSITNYIGGVILFTLAVLHTKIANVSVIQSLPLVAVFGFIFLKEKATMRKIILVMLAFIGAILISVKGGFQIRDIGVGELYAIFAAVFFALGYIARRWHSNLLNNKEITEIMLAIATITLFLGSFLFHEGIPTTGWNINTFVVYLVSGFLNVAALFLINYGFEHVKPVLASNLLTLESLFGLLLGFIFYKELPQIREIIGGVLIVSSVIFFNKEEFK